MTSSKEELLPLIKMSLLPLTMTWPFPLVTAKTWNHEITRCSGCWQFRAVHHHCLNPEQTCHLQHARNSWDCLVPKQHREHGSKSHVFPCATTKILNKICGILVSHTSRIQPSSLRWIPGKLLERCFPNSLLVFLKICSKQTTTCWSAPNRKSIESYKHPCYVCANIIIWHVFVSQTSHLYPDLCLPPRVVAHASMRLGRWRWPHRSEAVVRVNGADRPGKVTPLGFGVAKALQTLGVAICFHGFPWEVASRCLVGCFWTGEWGGGSFEAPKMDGCVCVFCLVGEGPKEFQMSPKFFQMVKSDLPCKKLKTKASSIGDSTIFNSVWKERLFAQSLKNFQHSIKSWLRQNKSLDRLLYIYIYKSLFVTVPKTNSPKMEALGKCFSFFNQVTFQVNYIPGWHIFMTCQPTPPLTYHPPERRSY